MTYPAFWLLITILHGTTVALPMQSGSDCIAARDLALDGNNHVLDARCIPGAK